MDRQTAQQALREARVEIAPDDHRPYEVIVAALAAMGMHISLPEPQAPTTASPLTNEGIIQ